jgi:hypothetical protein
MCGCCGVELLKEVIGDVEFDSGHQKGRLELRERGLG